MRSLFSIITIVFALLMVGCSGEGSPRGADMGSPDADSVAKTVEELNEAVGIPKKLEKLFTNGSVPKDSAKLTQHAYSVSGKPSVSGTTATCKVRLDKQSTGEKVAEPEWTFEKVGDKWLIKSAPLS